MANQTARRLRKNETIAEKQLWRELRQLRAQGYHFRRQHPIEGYIVDFA
jgi:very-short-patch-repair endonuclease